MNTLTYAQAFSEIRKIAKSNGMTFLRQNRLRINNKQAYKFINRKSGRLVGMNFTLWSAYDSCINGYVAHMMGR